MEITPTNKSEEIENLTSVFEQLETEIGPTHIEKLNPVTRRLSKIFKNMVEHDSIIQMIKKIGFLLKGIKVDQAQIEEIRRLQKGEGEGAGSTWGIYAALNLFGKEKQNPDFLSAIRFSHFLIVNNPEGEGFDSKTEIEPKLKKTLLDGFPWSGSNQSSDPRMESVKKAIREARKIPILNLDSEVEESKTELPAIIDLSSSVIENGKLILTPKNKKFIENQITNRPFIFIKLKLKNKIMFTAIANHQYLDGIPLTHHFANTFQNATELHPTEHELNLSDQLEHISSGEQAEQYQVKTIELSTEMTDKLNDIFSRIKKANNELYVSYYDFLQLFLLAHFGVNGSEIKGGVLGFNQNLSEQLGHFDVGNAQALLLALLDNNEQVLNPYLSKNDRGKKIDLYKPDRDNINLLRNLRQLPAAFIARLNVVAKRLKIDRGTSGQVMVSIVPRKIKGILGVGCSGPAATESQDMVVTAQVEFHEDKEAGAKSIILRIKRKFPTKFIKT